MKLEEYECERIRDVLKGLDPKSSSSAAKPLPVNQIYAPMAHRNALDIERPLVVGNRGTGKSVWSGALADKETRLAIAKAYKMPLLHKTEVILGFHEGAGQVEGVAPSIRTLSALLKNGVSPEYIWIAVLLKAVSVFTGSRQSKSIADLAAWVEKNPEACEERLRKADQFFTKSDKKFLIVFDALDRLGSSWREIRPLTNGILKLALEMQGYTSMRAKVFMRTDQYKDAIIFNFPDASKIRASTVELSWHPTELYGLLFKLLISDKRSLAPIDKLYRAQTKTAVSAYTDISTPDIQKPLFNSIAGEFMGSDHRRGRTYTWIIDHLADAFRETTPRSFLVTLQRAANGRQPPSNTVIDHHGIREGVQSASGIRVDQLSEDYPWISSALTDLEGLEVPCAPSAFVKRWRENGTIKTILDITTQSQLPGPVELEGMSSSPESLLIDSLINIGVIEVRSEEKINMPDIFRVAAKMKRRGGVRPPSPNK